MGPYVDSFRPALAMPAWPLMPRSRIHSRYRDLKRYVGFTDEDAERISAARPTLALHIPALVADFYAELQRHPDAVKVITGGPQQVARLQKTLHNWIEQFLTGPYDNHYVDARVNVGLRHVEIGLDQVYAAVAVARLRSGMIAAISSDAKLSPAQLSLTVQSINKLLDLDLAIISDVYEAEYVRRMQEAERERMQLLLHREKEFSEGLLAHAPAAVLVLDLEGVIQRFNPFFETLVGRSLDLLQGSDFIEACLMPEARKRARQELLAESLDEVVRQATFALEHPTGKLYEVRFSRATLRDPAGKPYAILLLGHDVTDLNMAQRRALEAERLAAIGQMSAGLAHEARNALQRIQAFCELLELEVESNASAVELVRRIQNAQGHMHRLFDEVRGYAAPVNLDCATCHPSEVWREAWELLQPQRSGRSAQLIEAPEGSATPWFVDRFRMVQVFRNLLENSLAACEDPVQVTISCTDTLWHDEPALRISVLDNGPGLSAEQKKRIFEPFYTTKTRGTGLGMAIATRLVEAHGGVIEVENRPLGSGAEIVVTVPLHTGQAMY